MIFAVVSAAFVSCSNQKNDTMNKTESEKIIKELEKNI
jgi:hypothetical protein